ncbi:hypothetical protein GCM10011360_21420 [Primorskyibacter flagellatus]|uniref:Chitooligosaccharide deacetylase n=1 Tax=Primorskyibacter flagellatus TaxID=1387277 RepID=A0A917EF61_9RHOB|nr:hypothetical protein GCM10011360_21420 [Primorskyibacter flagellatus]
MYHEVTDNPGETGFQRNGAIPYKHRVHHFLNDLEAIAAVHKRAVSVFEAAGTDQLSLLMTFDDGGISALHSAEMLNQRYWHGHFFVTTSMISTPGFLSEQQIVRLSRQGHTIGAHSHTHPGVFRNLAYSDKVDEWRQSTEILAEIVGSPVTTASVPGGDMDDDTIRSAAEAGIRYLFTSEPHYSPYVRHGVTVIGRACPKNRTPTTQVAAWANGRGFRRARAIRSAKGLVRIYGKPIYAAYIKHNERRFPDADKP